MISSASEWPNTNASDVDVAPRQNHAANTCYSYKSSVTSPDRTDNKVEEEEENITLMTAWESYKEFEEYSYYDRALSVREFIGEWELRLARAVHAGCHYSDAVLAFKLLERANLEKAELELGKNQGVFDLEKKVV